MEKRVWLDVKRGGVTGKPICTIEGLGDTWAGAVADCMTARPATRIRKGDFLVVREVDEGGN